MEYTPDESALEAKRDELIEAVRTLLDPLDARLAPRIVDSFCQFSPPVTPPMLLEMITADSGGYHGGQTRKPGNLRLNWRNLVREFGDIALNTAGAIAVPPLIPFAALSLWNKLWAHATISLSREHAAALFAMWHRRDEHSRITLVTALEETNALYRVFHWPEIDPAKFTNLLQQLEALDCIELEQNGSIWLREWVKTDYG